MMKQYLFNILLCTLFVMLVACGKQLNFSGSYESYPYGEVMLMQQGELVTGQYMGGNGTLEGIVNGDVLSGTFIEKSGHDGVLKGVFSFTINENKQVLKGTWEVTDPHSEQGSWTLNRIPSNELDAWRKKYPKHSILAKPSESEDDHHHH